MKIKVARRTQMYRNVDMGNKNNKKKTLDDDNDSDNGDGGGGGDGGCTDIWLFR